MNFVVCVFIETSCASLWREFIYSCYTRAHDLIDPRFAKIKGNTSQWWLCCLSVFCCGCVLLLQLYFYRSTKTKTTDKKCQNKTLQSSKLTKPKKKRHPQLPAQLPPKKSHTTQPELLGPRFLEIFFPRLRDVKCIQASSRAFAAIKADGSASWTSFCWLGFCRINILNLII